MVAEQPAGSSEHQFARTELCGLCGGASTQLTARNPMAGSLQSLCPAVRLCTPAMCVHMFLLKSYSEAILLWNKKPTFNMGVLDCYVNSSLLSKFLNEHSVLKGHLLHECLFYFKPQFLLCNLSIPIVPFTAVFVYVPNGPGFIILLLNKRITFKVQILVYLLGFLGANVDQLSLCAEMM